VIGGALLSKEWSSIDTDDVLVKLRSSLQGLSADEVDYRLQRDGKNKLIEPPIIPAWKKFLEQFIDPLVFLLIAAAIISIFVVHELGDGIFILFVITINAFFGWRMESQAEQAMTALKKMNLDTCVVIREEHDVIINSEDLVIGDLLKLEDGDNIPADVRIITSYQFHTDESSMTGESKLRKKTSEKITGKRLLAERDNMAYMGTVATNGRALGVIVSTGMNTELGKIADNVTSVETPKTPLETKLESLGRFLGGIALSVAILLLTLTLLFSYIDGDFTTMDGSGLAIEPIKQSLIEQFTVALAIFVAIVPEGLPIILVITLGLGMRNMARHRAIVRRIKAVETLGSTTVICTDKTGTLTRNEMTVVQFYSENTRYMIKGRGYDPTIKGITHKYSKKNIVLENLLKSEGLVKAFTCASLCNNSQISKEKDVWEAIGDPTCSATASFGWKTLGSADNIKKDSPRVHEFFFNTERKRMTTINELEDGKWAFTKGALDPMEPLLTKKFKNGELVDITDDDLEEIKKVNHSMASSALRVLALACKKIDEDVDYKDIENIESDLIFLGLIGIRDPPRSEAYEAIATCHEAGIRVIMITGDQEYTAKSVAVELEICGENSETISGYELDSITDYELIDLVEHVNVFCRVTPEQKMRIVQALQRAGHVVAMTGDGVNDAPALSSANIGIAMGISGTDVARDAADMVLQDDNFANIVHAVKEGRKIYWNIRNFVRYQVSTNVAAVLIIILSSFVFQWDNLPLTATQILVINILMDGPPAVALGLEKNHGSVMSRPPRPVAEGLPNLIDTVMIVFLGTLMAVGSLAVYYTVVSETTVDEAITATFAVFVMFQLFNVMNCRSIDKSIFQLGVFSNRAVTYSFIICTLLLISMIEFSQYQVPIINLDIGEFLSVQKFSNFNTWPVILILASSVLIFEEFRKFLMKNTKIFQ
jgi:Ca2+-transporting ATPase